MNTTTSIANTLSVALESNDGQALIDLYAADAELQVIDRNHQPSHPLTLRGKSAIAEYWTDICGRALSHRVERMIAAGDSLAYDEACKYPDGTAVRCVAIVELRDGLIARQVGVQAWDE
jgi:hypothetical protein